MSGAPEPSALDPMCGIIDEAEALKQAMPPGCAGLPGAAAVLGG